MNKATILYALVLLLGVFLGSVSQVLLKKSAQKEYDSVVKEYLNPLVLIAYCLFFGTTILSVFAYRGIPLSLGPVLEATSYVYVSIWGYFIFKEKITRKKLIALTLIVTGIIVYAFGGNLWAN